MTERDAAPTTPGVVRNKVVELLLANHPAGATSAQAIRDEQVLGPDGLGVGSLVLLHVFVKLEEAFGFTFDDASVANAKLSTVGELVSFVAAAVRGRGVAAGA